MPRKFIQTDVKLMRRIMDRCGPSAFLVYSVLQTHAHFETRKCHPSLPTICEEAKVCRAKAWEAIRSLAAIGAIKYTSGGGRGNQTEYTICSPSEAVETVHQINGSPDKRFTENSSPDELIRAETVHGNGLNSSREVPPLTLMEETKERELSLATHTLGQNGGFSEGSADNTCRYKLRQWGAEPKEIDRAFEELRARGMESKCSIYKYVQKVIIGYREEPQLPPRGTAQPVLNRGGTAVGDTFEEMAARELESIVRLGI